MAATQCVYAALDIRERLPLQAGGQYIDPRLKQFQVVAEKSLDGHGNRRCIWRIKFEDQIETSPQGWINQFRVIGGSQQKPAVWPLIDFLQHYSDQAFQFADIGLITASLGDGVDLIK